MTNACTISPSATPIDNNAVKSPGARNATRRHRQHSRPYSARTTSKPTSPSSSPMAARTKSVWPAGISLRIAETGTGAPQRAGGERPQPLRDLIAARHAVVPGIDPDGDALAHRRRKPELVGDGERQQQHADSDDHERDAAARDAVQTEKHERQHEGGTQILLQEKEQQHERHADDHRTDVLPAGNLQVAEPGPRRRRRLRELAQELEPAREIRRQRKDDEQPDRLDRLHAKQIDLRAARARSAAEHQQQRRQPQRQEERQRDRATEPRRFEIDERERDEGRGAADDAQRKAGRRGPCPAADPAAPPCSSGRCRSASARSAGAPGHRRCRAIGARDERPRTPRRTGPR